MSKQPQGPGWWLASDGLWYSPRERRRARPTGLYVGAALLGLLIAGIGIALLHSSKGGTPAADPVDVQAARACETFTMLMSHTATPTLLENAAALLIAGGPNASAPQGSRWAALGGDLFAVAGDVNTQNPAISADETKASNECASIPAAAKRAGGFVK